MAEVNGQLATCDRCGKTIFRKAIGEGEADGGFTRWNKFEPYPEGWGSVSVPDSAGIRYSYMKVCPVCRAQWEDALYEHFLKGTQYYKRRAGHET